MRYHLVCLTLLILTVGSAVGQAPRQPLERGKTEELKGLTRVFVWAPERDRSLARRVTLSIQKELPGLDFVASPVDAEIWLWVYSVTESESSRIPPDLSYPPNAQGAGQTRLSTEPVPGLRGSVRILGSGKFRLIMEFSKTGGGRKQMAEQFAKEFIRAYQKAAADPVSKVAG